MQHGTLPITIANAPIVSRPHAFHHPAQMANPIQLTQPQLQQLIQGLQPQQPAQQPVAGGPGVEKFSSGAPEEWMTWRRTFLVVAQIQGWNAQRAKREIVAAMKGRAAMITRDIAYADNAITTANLLDSYEARFVPQAASRLARNMFAQNAQRPDEDIRDFHGRLRELFMRAYPDYANDAEASTILIDQFTRGLVDRVIAQYVADQNPGNYTDALTFAENRFANDQSRGIHQIAAMSPNGFMAAIGQGAQLCYYCNKPGHIKRDCFSFLRAQGKPVPTRGTFRGRRAGRRGRGGRGGRGRGGRGGYNLAALEFQGEQQPQQQQQPHLAAIEFQGAQPLPTPPPATNATAAAGAATFGLPGN